MLPRLYRLKNKSDFDHLLKKGKIENTQFLAIRFIDRTKSQSQQNSRFGFLAAKKNFKKAVLRNKIRRRLRELIGQRLFLIKPGNDIALIARPGIEDKRPIEAKELLETILKQAKLFKTQIK